MANEEYNLAVWTARLGAFVRPSILLFVMLTGALLLPVRMEMEAFYKKRFFFSASTDNYCIFAASTNDKKYETEISVCHQ